MFLRRGKSQALPSVEAYETRPRREGSRWAPIIASGRDNHTSKLLKNGEQGLGYDHFRPARHRLLPPSTRSCLNGRLEYGPKERPNVHTSGANGTTARKMPLGWQRSKQSSFNNEAQWFHPCVPKKIVPVLCWCLFHVIFVKAAQIKIRTYCNNFSRILMFESSKKKAQSKSEWVVTQVYNADCVWLSNETARADGSKAEGKRAYVAHIKVPPWKSTSRTRCKRRLRLGSQRIPPKIAYWQAN